MVVCRMSRPLGGRRLVSGALLLQLGIHWQTCQACEGLAATHCNKYTKRILCAKTLTKVLSLVPNILDGVQNPHHINTSSIVDSSSIEASSRDESILRRSASFWDMHLLNLTTIIDQKCVLVAIVDAVISETVFHVRYRGDITILPVCDRFAGPLCLRTTVRADKWSTIVQLLCACDR